MSLFIKSSSRPWYLFQVILMYSFGPLWATWKNIQNSVYKVKIRTSFVIWFFQNFRAAVTFFVLTSRSSTLKIDCYGLQHTHHQMGSSKLSREENINTIMKYLWLELEALSTVQEKNHVSYPPNIVHILQMFILSREMPVSEGPLSIIFLRLTYHLWTSTTKRFTSVFSFNYVSVWAFIPTTLPQHLGPFCHCTCYRASNTTWSSQKLILKFAPTAVLLSTCLSSYIFHDKYLNYQCPRYMQKAWESNSYACWIIEIKLPFLVFTCAFDCHLWDTDAITTLLICSLQGLESGK